MTDRIKDGGPAFAYGNFEQGGEPGMNLRDYAAIHAPEPPEEWMHMQRGIDRNRNPHNEPHKPSPRDDFELVAAYKYAHADAMLAEREKQND